MDRLPPRACVVGLGANIGSPVEAFQSALTALRGQLQVVEVSALYRSGALGPPQPDYLNAALLLALRSDPFELLAELGRIEQSQGRLRRERWGPRTLDLDILWIRGTAVDSPTLTVPHPRLTERAFALLPLLELVPDAIEPSSGRPYTKYLPAVQHQQIERLREPWR